MARSRSESRRLRDTTSPPGHPNPSCSGHGGRFIGGEEVSPNTPLRIGSVGKNLGAAILREVLSAALRARGHAGTREEVEALRLVDGEIQLVPDRLDIVLKRERPPYVDVPGDCGQLADPRWRDLTVGHLLSHSAGIPTTHVDLASGTNLMAVREVTSVEQLETMQAEVDPPREAIEDGAGEGFFIPPHDNAELMFALAGKCLAYTPGAGVQYSNPGFDLVSLISANVSGAPETALSGEPETHADSLLYAFLRDEFEINSGTRSAHGMYLSQPYIDARDPAEPRYRAWDGRACTHYPKRRDPKRPYCRLGVEGEAASCSLDDWSDEDPRINHQWERANVPLSYDYYGSAVTTGLLAAEAPLLLRFVQRFWLGRTLLGESDGEPFYGRRRDDLTSPVARSHGGNLPGTTAWAAQFVGGEVAYREIPIDFESGVLGFSAQASALLKRTCDTIPAGLDLVVIFNQSRGRVCHRAEYGCDAAMSQWRDALIEALCAVDWDAFVDEPAP